MTGHIVFLKWLLEQTGVAFKHFRKRGDIPKWPLLFIDIVVVIFFTLTFRAAGYYIDVTRQTANQLVLTDHSPPPIDIKEHGYSFKQESFSFLDPLS